MSATVSKPTKKKSSLIPLGDRVVVDGIQRLKPGAKIIDMSKLPKPAATTATTEAAKPAAPTAATEPAKK